MDNNGQNPHQESNVIDMHSRRSILPNSVRRTLENQYEVSKQQNHSAEQFIAFAERRVMGEMAHTGAEVIRNFIRDLFK